MRWKFLVYGIGGSALVGYVVMKAASPATPDAVAPDFTQRAREDPRLAAIRKQNRELLGGMAAKETKEE